jgi:competence protein ComEC
VPPPSRFVRLVLATIALSLLACAPEGPLAQSGDLLPPLRAASTPLTVTVLELDARVGGLAVLLSDSSGERARHVLIDGGGDERQLVAELRRFGVEELALVVLTHPHTDHYAGLAEVVRGMPVRVFAWSGDTRTLASFQRLLSAVDSSGATPMIIDSGVRRVSIVSDEDTLWVVMLPPPDQPLRGGDAINNRSVGVRVERAGFRMFVPGDAEHQQLGWWSERYADLLDVDILVASHHGSDDANATQRRPALYRIVTPEVLLVSANGRQHPYGNVLEFAAQSGVRLYCTHTHGMLVVRVEANGAWRVEPERDAPCTKGTTAPR